MFQYFHHEHESRCLFVQLKQIEHVLLLLLVQPVQQQISCHACKKAASPESSSFVSVGQQVTPDTTICIIEAMKVMNEIKAETSGVITEILAENGKPVQYGQALFRIR